MPPNDLATAETIAAPVWARRLPWPLNEMEKPTEALTTLYGAGLHMAQRGQFIVVFTPGQACDCLRCDQDVDRVIDVASPHEFRLPNSRMYLCPECGGKRCERAHDHRLPCDTTITELFKEPTT